MSHIAVAHVLVGVERYRLKIFPHRYMNQFRYASVFYDLKMQPTEREKFLISMAPRFMDCIAIVFFPLTGFMSGYPFIVFSILLGAGFVDLFVNSLGVSRLSDFSRVVFYLKINPWLFRAMNFAAIIISVVFFVLARMCCG